MALNGFAADLLGTMRSLFHVDGPKGPQIAASNSDLGPCLETLLPDGSTYTIHRGADPLLPNDFATKGYVDAAAAPNTQKLIRFTVDLADVSSVLAIPQGAIITRATVKVVTQYSIGATVTLGFAGGLAAYMDVAQSDLVTPTNSFYFNEQDTEMTSGVDEVVVATVAGAPAVGQCIVSVTYAMPGA